MVQGTITTEKINNSTLDSYSGYDYGGAGTLWRTKVIFTPTKRLSPNTVYRVYISGDEDNTDNLSTGIRARSVFDTVKGANIGTGDATFSGTYSGVATSDTLVVSVYTAGNIGTARFTWYRNSAPLLVYGPFKITYGLIPIVDDVSISFEDGSYEVGDTFSTVVKTGSIFSGNVTYPFTTGTGSIQTVPASTSTTITGTPTSSTATSTLFTISSTSPSNRATNISDTIDQDYSVVITFSDTLDASTITDSSISVETEPVNGDVDTILSSGILPKTLTVDDNELTIVIGSGYILRNNVVTITIDDSVSSSSGTSLSDDYEFYFTSEYYPLYSSTRKIKLEYGAYIGEIPDDTINLAIFEASLAAENLTWNTSTTTTGDYYQWVRKEFTTCKAAETLLTNVIGQSRGLRSKSLGDFRVEYDARLLENGIDKALGCLDKWLASLQSRGAAVQTPSFVIKGAWDTDRPPVGRGWTPPNRGMPIAKAKSRASTSRRWTSGYYNPSRGRSGGGNTH